MKQGTITEIQRIRGHHNLKNLEKNKKILLYDLKNLEEVNSTRSNFIHIRRSEVKPKLSTSLESIHSDEKINNKDQLPSPGKKRSLHFNIGQISEQKISERIMKERKGVKKMSDYVEPYVKRSIQKKGKNFLVISSNKIIDGYDRFRKNPSSRIHSLNDKSYDDEIRRYKANERYEQNSPEYFKFKFRESRYVQKMLQKSHHSQNCLREAEIMRIRNQKIKMFEKELLEFKSIQKKESKVCYYPKTNFPTQKEEIALAKNERISGNKILSYNLRNEHGIGRSRRYKTLQDEGKDEETRVQQENFCSPWEQNHHYLHDGFNDQFIETTK